MMPAHVRKWVRLGDAGYRLDIEVDCGAVARRMELTGVAFVEEVLSAVPLVSVPVPVGGELLGEIAAAVVGKEWLREEA